MCAESVRPFITRLARSDVQDTFYRAIDLCWSFCFNALKQEEIEELQWKIKKFPEAEADDSNSPDYDVMLALSIIYYALESISVAENSELSAINSASGAADIYASVDVILSQSNLNPIMIDPHNPPPPGELEKSQIESQLALIKHMKNSADQHSVIDSAHLIAKSLEELLDENMSNYMVKKGWSKQPV